MSRRSLQLRLLLLVAALVCAFSSASSASASSARFPSRAHFERLLATSGGPRALQATSDATCDEAASSSAFAQYLEVLPATAGIRGCVASNIATLYAALSAGGSCELTTLVGLFSANESDASSAAFSDFFGMLLGGILSSSASGSGSTADLATSLASWNEDAATNTAGFCSVMNTQAGPCIDALLPAIVDLLASGATCCTELSDYFEVAQVIVPSGQTLDQTLVNIVNGLHRSMCMSAGSDLCGQALTSFLGDALTTNDTALVSALVVHAGTPLYAAGSDICSELEGTSLTSRLDGSTAIPYYAASCCAAGISALMESLDEVIAHVSGNAIPELLNLMTGRQNLEASSQFASPYDTIDACSFGTTCAAPEFLLTASSGSATNSTAAVTAKTATEQNVTCTRTNLCDADNVCSSVCEAGTAIIEPWVARAITYQRNLTYDQTLCYAELPATHNSVITRARGYGNRDQLMNAVLNATNSDSYVRTNNQVCTLSASSRRWMPF